MARDEAETTAAVERRRSRPEAGVGTDVFLSYSRRDRDFAKRLHAALVQGGKAVYVDWEDIPDWSPDYESELFDGIDRADSFLLVLSPDSLESPNVLLELDRAAAQGKRIKPLLRRDLHDTSVPEPVRRPQWLDFRDDDTFGETAARLLEALSVDADWVRRHTRIGLRAGEWDRRGRDSSFLLRGSDLREAEAWLAEQAGKDPPPTDLQSQYVNASRRAATRRQRIAMAAVAAALAITAALAVFSLIQRNQANRQRDAANSGSLLSAASAQHAHLDIALLLALAAASTKPDSPSVESSVIAALKRARETRAEAILHDDTAVAYGVAWKADGRMLATASENGTVRLWRLRTRERLEPPLEADGGPLAAVAFDPVRPVVAAGGRGGLFLWSVGGRLLRHIPASTGPITALAYGSDGSLVAGTDRGHLWRWETPADAGGALSAIPGPITGPITAIAIAKDGRIAYANEHAAFVTAGFALPAVPVSPVPSEVRALAFSPSGTTLAVAGGEKDGDAHTGMVQLFDAGTLEPTVATPRARDPEPTDLVESLSFDRDGSMLAGCGPDGTVWLWDGRTAAVRDRYRADGGHLHSVAFDPTAHTTFAAAANDGAVLVWKAGHPAFGAPTAGDGARREFVTRHDGGVIRLAGPHARTITGDGRVASVALSDNGEWLAASTAAGFVRVWSTASGRPAARSAAGPFTAVAVDDKGERIATGAASGAVRIWDLRTRRRIDLRGHSAKVQAIAFDPSGTTLATGGKDSATYLWDVRTHRRLAALRLGGPIWSLAFSPDGRLLATGQKDGIRLWDANAHVLISDRFGDGRATALRFTHDGRELISFGHGGRHVWAGILWSDLDDLRGQVCGLVYPGLTPSEWDEFAPTLESRVTCPVR